MGRVLAVDPGTKRIGFAISDEDRVLARPHSVWNKKKLAEDLAHIAHLVEENEIESIVVGVPYRLDGSQGPAADKSLALIEAIRGRLPGVEVLGHDEALTTWEADELLKSRGLDPKARRTKIDAYAACVLLEEFLAQKPT